MTTKTEIPAAGDRPVADYWSPEVQAAVVPLVALIATQTSEVREEMSGTLRDLAAVVHRAGSTEWHGSTGALLNWLPELIAAIGDTTPDPRRRLKNNLPAQPGDEMSGETEG